MKELQRIKSTRIKGLALLQIFIILSATFLFSLSLSAEDVTAAQVCCEKTKSNGFCEQVEESECASNSQRAPTSCEQTSFCRTGCCASDDGYCYSNYPKAFCESSDVNGRFNNDATCGNVNECKVGCCVIGGQSSFLTRSRCIAETANFGDLEVDFREDISNEQDCLEISRTAEKGCCVSESGCRYGTKGECSFKTNVNGTGFYKDKYCSELTNLCNCAPANPSINIGNIHGNGDLKSTTCASWDDSVFWRDSCGNPEGVKEKCDYAKGTLCGDSDNDGKFKCESVDCKENGKNTLQDKYSFNFLESGKISKAVDKEEIKNGETWCLWDYPSDDFRDNFYGKDPVGSRHYRSLCINGQELIEPCADFRKEFCYSNDISVAGSNQNNFLASRCLKNDRWQSCINDCNTADPFKMNADNYKRALEKDAECCSNIDKRDCQWAGKCVPAVKPGYKFWEGEGVDTCSKANLDCTATFVCDGWNALFGICNPNSDKDIGGRFGKYAGLLGIGALAGVVAGGGFGALGGLVAVGIMSAIKQIKDTDNGWVLVAGGECFSKDYLQATNNYCRSLGDCGADTNWVGDSTSDGFTNTENIKKDYEDVLKNLGSSGVYGRIQDTHGKANFKGQAAEDLKNSLKYLDKKPEDIPGKLDEKPDWEKGDEFFDFTSKASDKKNLGQRFIDMHDWGRYWGGVFATALGSVGLVKLFNPITLSPGLFVGSLSNTIPGMTTVITKAAGFADNDKVVQEFLGKATDKTALQNALQEGAKASIDKEQVAFDLAKENLAKENKILIKTGHQNFEFVASDGKIIKVASNEEVTKLAGGDKAVEQQVTKIQQQAASEASTTAGQSMAYFMSGINAGMWVYTAYSLLDTLLTQTKSVTVSTQCKPWQAPPVKEEDQCEKCNANFVDITDTGNSYVDDNGIPININAFKKCSEYRCKSLGASCELINKGSDKELCVSVFKFDVNAPKIDPWKEGISQELQNKISKEGFDQPGFGITEELPEYKRFNLAIKTDKPSQCKMSFDKGKKFEDMSNNYFGGNLYDYYHVQPIFYASSTNRTTSEELTISADVEKTKEYKLFVRCQDAQGNANMNDFVMTFKVSGAPDITAPIIYGTSIGQEAYVTHGQNETKLSLFVNEPGECKFDLSAVKYEDMKGGSCLTSSVDSLGFYECHFTNDPGAGPSIKGIDSKAGQIKYVYFKCQDKNKNFNKEAFRLTLRGSDELKIRTVDTDPKAIDNEIKTSLSVTPVNLLVQTDNGAKLNGESVCKYTQQESLKNNYAAMSLFLETNSTRHKQIFDSLSTGSHTFFVGCSDIAGNLAFNQTSFSLTSDAIAPVIVRAYRDSSLQPPAFKIEVNEDATCKDSMVSFDYDKEGNLMVKDGNVHSSSSEASNVYHIICRDAFNNTMSEAQVQFV